MTANNLINSAMRGRRIQPQQPAAQQPSLLQQFTDPRLGQDHFEQSGYSEDMSMLQAEAEASIDISQQIRGIIVCYKRFRVVMAAYAALTAVMSGEQEPPIIQLPTGYVDDDKDGVAMYELDLKQVLPTDCTEDQRLAVLQTQIRPWVNYLEGEYRRLLRQLARVTAQADQSINGAPQAPARPASAVQQGRVPAPPGS